MLSCLVVAAALAAPADSVDTTRYFFILYGGQSIPFRPRTAHTWATFVKATPTANGSAQLESLTISWLPASGVVRPWRLRAEPGKNHTLEETFAIARIQGNRVSMWGPFEIRDEWYTKAAWQVERLENGEVRYRVLDSLGFSNTVAHCVRAITASDTIRQWRIQPVLQVGEPGTSRLAAEYVRKGVFNGGPATHDWVLPAIGADQYPVVRREPGEHIRRQRR